MHLSFNFKNKSFAVYGLGLTGNSVVNFLKKNKANKIYTWDDYSVRSTLKIKKTFKKNLNFVDYIVVSPGINIKKSTFKTLLFKSL